MEEVLWVLGWERRRGKGKERGKVPDHSVGVFVWMVAFGVVASGGERLVCSVGCAGLARGGRRAGVLVAWEDFGAATESSDSSAFGVDVIVGGINT